MFGNGRKIPAHESDGSATCSVHREDGVDAEEECAMMMT